MDITREQLDAIRETSMHFSNKKSFPMDHIAKRNDKGMTVTGAHNKPINIGDVVEHFNWDTMYEVSEIIETRKHQGNFKDPNAYYFKIQIIPLSEARLSEIVESLTVEA